MKAILRMAMLAIFMSTYLMAQSISFFSPQNGTVTDGTYYNHNTDRYTINIPFNYGRSLTPVGYEFAYVILHTHNSTFTNPQNNESFDLLPGTYTWTLELYEMEIGAPHATKTAEQSVTFTVKYEMYAATNVGGSVIVDGTPKTSGAMAVKSPGNSLSVSVNDQTISDRERVWNTSNINKSEWRRQDIEGANTHITDSRQYSYSVASGDNGTILRGYLRPVYLMDFSVSGGGNVRVGTTYGSSIEDIEVVESNPVTAEVLPLYDQNGIDFYFKEWSDNNTSNPRTFLQQVMPPILLQELAMQQPQV